MPNGGSLVHAVVVSPPNVTISVGSTLSLGASVDADASVTVRTVAWSSGDSSIAKVSAAGLVTGVAPGTTAIVAAATAAPNVKGTATVTVMPAPPPPVPTIGILGATTTSCVGSQCTELPADLQNFGTGSPLPGASGQLIVALSIDTKGLSIKSYGVALKCGTDSIATVQTTVGPTKLTLNTTSFDPTTGVPAVHNATSAKPCALSASVAPTTGATQTTPSQSVVLNNADGAVVTTTTSGPTTTDMLGFVWQSGAVTLGALPVLYSGRRPAQMQFNLPNAKGQTQLVRTAASGATTATWPNATTSTVNVAQLTIAGTDVSGFPSTVHPTVTAFDSIGVASLMPQLNPGAQSDIRLDNQAPQSPRSFQIPQSQSQWVNAAYTFSGAGPSPLASDARYVSCGDAPAAPATVPPPANPQPPCATPQSGVSANGQFVAGLNGQTTLSFYFVPAATYTSQSLQVSSTGTSDSPADCDLSKWKKITKAGDIASTSSPNNQQYVARAVEADKLGNARCTDLSASNGMINTTGGVYVPGKFGVDVVPPAAKFVDGDVTAVSANDVCPFFVGGTQQVPVVNLPCGSGGATIKSFKISASDDASGFSLTPVAATLRRLAVVGTAQATVCVIGSGSACDAVPRALQTIAADANALGASSGIDGYYTLTATISDFALNAAATLTRTALVDRAPPVMGGVSVPATLVGGTNVQFAATVADNVDLAASDFTLVYAIAPATGFPVLSLRLPGPALGTPFSNTLTPTASFNYTASNFIRALSPTTSGNVPQNVGIVPNIVIGRAFDAANNESPTASAVIDPARVPQGPPLAAPHTDFTVSQANGAQFLTFRISNVATKVSNCAPCAGGAANPTSVTLIAEATGTEQGASAQFANPFAQVQFYYLNAATSTWSFIGAASTPAVAENGAQTVRTLTWSLPGFDPPVSIGTGPLTIVAIGVNTAGDALVTVPNTSITLTNP